MDTVGDMQALLQQKLDKGESNQQAKIDRINALSSPTIKLLKNIQSVHLPTNAAHALKQIKCDPPTYAKLHSIQINVRTLQTDRPPTSISTVTSVLAKQLAELDFTHLDREDHSFEEIPITHSQNQDTFL